MIGTTFLHYRTHGELGQGGMGIVYEAEDTRLHRVVALKCVNAVAAHDSGQQERLRREARTAAALNHPNIATVYGLEECDGQLFLVMEYIEGQTLYDLVRSTPDLAIETVLAIARQSASGLAAAHGMGIVHRDIKSQNIMITADGQIKIEAIEQLRKALAVDPLNAVAYREMAAAFARLGQIGQAEVTYLQAIELKPNYWANYYRLALFYHRRSEYVKAEKNYPIVTQLTPLNHIVYPEPGGPVRGAGAV
ncbi:MAG: protein kinase [candidate division KSB1 bacterium]|nr:protein kinase [candidate division KSB1 bacterium]